MYARYYRPATLPVTSNNGAYAVLLMHSAIQYKSATQEKLKRTIVAGFKKNTY